MSAQPAVSFRDESGWRIGVIGRDAMAEPDVLADIQDAVHRSLEERPARRLALDLAAVQYIASNGMSLLLMLHKRQREAGGELTLCGLDANVARSFHVARLDRVFEIHESSATLLRDRPDGTPAAAAPKATG